MITNSSYVCPQIKRVCPHVWKAPKWTNWCFDHYMKFHEMINNSTLRASFKKERNSPSFKRIHMCTQVPMWTSAPFNKVHMCGFNQLVTNIFYVHVALTNFHSMLYQMNHFSCVNQGIMSQQTFEACARVTTLTKPTIKKS